MPADRTRRTTTSRDAAEAAFKAATTKPAELPPKRPTIPNAKELVSLRIDRDILDHFQEAGLRSIQCQRAISGDLPSAKPWRSCRAAFPKDGTNPNARDSRLGTRVAIVQCAVSVAASSSTRASSGTAAAVVVVSSHSIG